MLTGHKADKRPADVIGNAIKIARIATDEETDPLPARRSGSEFQIKAIPLNRAITRKS